MIERAELRRLAQTEDERVYASEGDPIWAALLVVALVVLVLVGSSIVA